jgi:ADP-ribose pyrophosphatase
MARNFKVTDKVSKYKSPWLELKEYTISRDDQEELYGVIERRDGAVVIATASDGRVLFVKQYRFPIESYSWELPMGGIEHDEDASAAASRELVEETGADTTLSPLGIFTPDPGLSPQKAFVFETKLPNEALSHIESFNEDVDEIVERRLLTPAEIRDMIRSGDIHDGFTLGSLALKAYA